jgi:DNA invertase Pin-like site-specific DNA recombinase
LCYHYLVEDYMTKELTQKEFARMGGKTKSPARAEASRTNGKLGGRPVNPDKEEALQMLKTHSVTEVAEHFGVARSTVCRWAKK